MNRLALAPIAAALLISASPLTADAAGILRPNVLVDSDVIKLGDLFDDAGTQADTPVARAPAPGRRVTVDSDWLMRIARANGLDWRANSSFDQAVIERASQTITHDQIENELASALSSQQGLPDHAEIELSNRVMQITVPTGAPASVAVRDLFYDNRYKRFTATIEAPADQPNAQRVRVSGRVFNTIEVPVIGHGINRGEVIRASDLTFIRVREDSLRRDILTDADQVIGMAPRQGLRNGQMLSASDLQKPIAVQRGALVTMVLKYGTMALSTQGRAQEQGSVGDTIRVMNTHSNQIIQAKIESSETVSVPLMAGVALAN